jgi:glycosyltransferase involved in cell wall biosynthesis
VAIVSLLFDWPSTGGGTVHTAETGKFLQRAGYTVKHFFAQYADWGVGNVTQPLDVSTEALAFDQASWNAAEIQRGFREAVDRFSPDYVIITDSWNFKPLLAEALSGYRYFLRLAAMECLCPLNNVRLLVDAGGRPTACPRHQLASPHICSDCVMRRWQQSGSLHQAERSLSGFGTVEYDQKLRQAFAQAAGVLVVNPLIAAMVSPFSSVVHVVPSGFDPERFPWPLSTAEAPDGCGRSPDRAASADNGTQTNNLPPTLTQIFFAGLVNEYMKGFHVLHEACRELWKSRQDFELVATADPAGQVDAFTQSIGWQSQEDLPRRIRDADFLVFPTIAEEALGRSAVEAMGAGRAVIASRIGGLPFTVSDGATGLLFEPGNADDLAQKMARLLDDAALRERMGLAGRKKFEEEFTWPVIIERHYRHLLRPVRARS